MERSLGDSDIDILEDECIKGGRYTFLALSTLPKVPEDLYLSQTKISQLNQFLTKIR
jgi:hypothetical protein